MIKTTERVTHNGKTFEPGEEIEKINKEQAERLVDLGVAIFADENEDKSENDLAKELDDAGNAEKLKEAAEKVELEFPNNISKGKLIKLILDKDKADEVLSLLKDEE